MIMFDDRFEVPPHQHNINTERRGKWMYRDVIFKKFIHNTLSE